MAHLRLLYVSHGIPRSCLFVFPHISRTVCFDVLLQSLLHSPTHSLLFICTLFPLCQLLLFVLHLAPLLSVSVRPPRFHDPAPVGSVQFYYLPLAFSGLLSLSQSVTYQTLARWYAFVNNDTSVPQVAGPFLQWESVEVINQLNWCKMGSG